MTGPSELDALAAAARPFHVRVRELEAAAHHRGLVLQRRAVEIDIALGVDEHAHGAVLECQHLVFGAWLLIRPLEQVREARATAAADADAQPLRRLCPRRTRLLYLGDRLVRDCNGHLRSRPAVPSSDVLQALPFPFAVLLPFPLARFAL